MAIAATERYTLLSAVTTLAFFSSPICKVSPSRYPRRQHALAAACASHFAVARL